MSKSDLNIVYLKDKYGDTMYAKNLKIFTGIPYRVISQKGGEFEIEYEQVVSRGGWISEGTTYEKSIIVLPKQYFYTRVDCE